MTKAGFRTWEYNQSAARFWEKPIDPATHDALLQLLGKAMSDVSEECYCASWLVGIEDMIPDLCGRALSSGQPQQWGGGAVTVQIARGLTYLADQLGCWANLSDVDDSYVPYQPRPVARDAVQPA